MLLQKKININLFYYLFTSFLLVFLFLKNDLNSFNEAKYQLLLLIIVFIISIFTENYKENILLKILIFHFFIFYIFRIPFSIIQDNQLFDIRYVSQIEIKNSIINLIFQYISIYVAIFIINPQISFNNFDKSLKNVDQNLPIINFLIWLILSIMFLNFLFNLFGTINYDNYSKYLAIIIIYLIMAYMIYNYNLPNIGDERPLYDSFMNGGLLGMMAYAIFDLTNYAIFNKWALKEAIIDILWGGFLFTIVGYIVHKFNF